jgi:hypothetical protein
MNWEEFLAGLNRPFYADRYEKMPYFEQQEIDYAAELQRKHPVLRDEPCEVVALVARLAAETLLDFKLK